MQNDKTTEFRGKDEFRGDSRGSVPRLDTAVKTQIPRFGSKFQGPGKYCGPITQWRR